MSHRYTSERPGNKPYARPASHRQQQHSVPAPPRQTEASLLGGLFKKAKSLFGGGSAASEVSSPALVEDRGPPPALAAAADSRSSSHRPVAHRLAAEEGTCSTPVTRRTSARGTTPVATLNLGSSNPFTTGQQAAGSRHRGETSFRSPSLSGLHLRSPSPNQSIHSPNRPGASFFHQQDHHRSQSPFKRSLAGSPDPYTSTNAAPLTGMRRSASVASVGSSSAAPHQPASPRKRQMLWDPAQGFVASSALENDTPQASNQKPTNDAERILSQLESMSGLHHHHPSSGVSLHLFCLLNLCL